MKTISEYEANDIDMSNELHGLLIVALAISAISFKREGEPPEDTGKRVAAQFLNILSRSGYVITKSELPAVFSN